VERAFSEGGEKTAKTADKDAVKARDLLEKSTQSIESSCFQ
jgi:hypothetical protein